MTLHGKQNTTRSQRSAISLKRKPNSTSTSPLIPCLRRVPFDATKRNQKSPLGAGPAICTARIASRDAPKLLPYLRKWISISRVGRNHALCSDSALEWRRGRNRRSFLTASSNYRSAIRPGDGNSRMHIPWVRRRDEGWKPSVPGTSPPSPLSCEERGS